MGLPRHCQLLSFFAWNSMPIMKVNNKKGMVIIMRAIAEPKITNKEEANKMYESFKKVFEDNGPYEVRADYRAAFLIWADEFINNKTH